MKKETMKVSVSSHMLHDKATDLEVKQEESENKTLGSDIKGFL